MSRSISFRSAVFLLSEETTRIASRKEEYVLANFLCFRLLLLASFCSFRFTLRDDSVLDCVNYNVRMSIGVSKQRSTARYIPGREE